MGELVLASLLWDANEKSERFSLAYDDSWAVKLFNGFRRNVTVPHRCVLYTDRQRDLPAHIEQIVQPDLGCNGYGDCVRLYEMNEPMILVGLDTLIVRNIDKLARWCLANPGKLALPKHPYRDISINGVQLWGGGNPAIFADWRGENDMDWMRSFPHERIDDLWPDRVVSWKARVANRGPGAAQIIYFHGKQKFDRLAENNAYVRANWQ